MRTIVGDPDMVGALFFGNTVQQDRQFLQSQERSWIAQGVSGFVSAFTQKAEQIAQAFTSNAAEQLISNAMNNVRGLFMPDVIYSFRDARDMQIAKPRMQEYIMAQPDVRELYHKRLCDGYSDTYVDPAPGVIGVGHEAYEHVMSGVVQFNDEGFQITHHSRAWADEDARHLSDIQQAGILYMYQEMKKIIESGSDIDITNKWGGSL